VSGCRVENVEADAGQQGRPAGGRKP
jgi:hypothetical protein